MNPDAVPNGGPAFPCDHIVDDDDGLSLAKGMTLRDYFAAKALQGICASETHLDRIGSFANAAATAYELADAMLKERMKS